MQVRLLPGREPHPPSPHRPGILPGLAPHPEGPRGGLGQRGHVSLCQRAVHEGGSGYGVGHTNLFNFKPTESLI